MDINALFDCVISTTPKPPKTYTVSLTESDLTELFEFLLEFFTMLCKYFYGNSEGQVDLINLSPNDINHINQYMLSIGFNSMIDQLPANYNNTQYYSENRYDKITINDQTKLNDLFFALKFGHKLNVIHFDII
jgi:hypothetical protein